MDLYDINWIGWIERHPRPALLLGVGLILLGIALRIVGGKVAWRRK